jgi:hypothetical protein
VGEGGFSTALEEWLLLAVAEQLSDGSGARATKAVEVKSCVNSSTQSS